MQEIYFSETGVDNAWEQKNLEDSAESLTSGARFVRRRFDYGLILSQLHQFDFDLDTN
jgi:hypothetical protein